MLNIVRADLFRISKSKMFKVSVIISTISAVGIALLLHLEETGAVSKDVTVNFSLLVDSFLVYFLGAMLIGNLVSKDFESKNIHDEIASGNGRIAIIAAKAISSAIMTAALVLPYALTAIIGFSANIKFSTYMGIPSVFYSILGNAAGVAVSGSSIIKCIGICALVVLIYVARLSILVPIAFKTKKVIPVTIIGIMISFGFDFLFAMVKGVEKAANTLRMLPYAATYDLDLAASGSTCIKTVLSCVVFTYVMISITNGLFHKSEIK